MSLGQRHSQLSTLSKIRDFRLVSRFALAGIYFHKVALPQGRFAGVDWANAHELDWNDLRNLCQCTLPALVSFEVCEDRKIVECTEDSRFEISERSHKTADYPQREFCLMAAPCQV